jgi:hypothetical protein
MQSLDAVKPDSLTAWISKLCNPTEWNFGGKLTS